MDNCELMWTKFRAFLLVCWQDTQLRQLPNVSNMSSNSPRIFLYRFLEAEYPNHNNQLNNGWKAATDGEYPPGETFKHDLWFVGFRRFTSTVHSPTGPGLGRPWPLWQYRAALWKLCCPKFLLTFFVTNYPATNYFTTYAEQGLSRREHTEPR